MSAVPGQPGQPVPPSQPVPPGQPGAPVQLGAPGKTTGSAGQPRAKGAVPPGYEPKTPWTAYIKPVLWTVVALYVIAFVFLNRDSVAINFIFFTTEVPLIFVLVGVMLIGAALCAGVMVMTRRRAAKKAKLAAAAPPPAAAGKKK
jgi:uncharacterized integral membrane protein